MITMMCAAVAMIVGSRVWYRALNRVRAGEARQAVFAVGVVLNAGGILVAVLLIGQFTAWPWLWAAAASALGVAQIVPYIRSILRGHTRPSRTGTGIWAAAEIVAAGAYLAAGGGHGTALQVVFAVTGVAVFVLALRYGTNGTAGVDVACAFTAAVALAALIGGSPVVAVLASTLASAAGYIAVIAKTWQHPGTENTLSWTLTTLAAVCSVTAVLLQGGGLLLVLPAAVTLLGSITVLIADQRIRDLDTLLRVNNEPLTERTP